MMEPQDIAAFQFMRHKGLSYVQPTTIEKVDGETCWYYIYDLPSGELELEVFWDGTEWETTVCTFNGRTRTFNVAR